MGRLFECTDLDLQDLVLNGELSPRAFDLHHWMRCRARRSAPLGVVRTCAPDLARERDHSVAQVHHDLRELEGAALLKRFRTGGQRGPYPIVLDRFFIERDGERFRIDASKTHDWRKPHLEALPAPGRRTSSRPVVEAEVEAAASDLAQSFDNTSLTGVATSGANVDVSLEPKSGRESNRQAYKENKASKLQSFKEADVARARVRTRREDHDVVDGELEVLDRLNELARTTWGSGPATRYLRERLSGIGGRKYTPGECIQAVREAHLRDLDSHPKLIFSASVLPGLLTPKPKRKSVDGLDLRTGSDWVG